MSYFRLVYYILKAHNEEKTWLSQLSSNVKTKDGIKFSVLWIITKCFDTSPNAISKTTSSLVMLVAG